jgi:hypothetical protein
MLLQDLCMLTSDFSPLLISSQRIIHKGYKYNIPLVIKDKT